jgi:hypothetical protein
VPRERVERLRNVTPRVPFWKQTTIDTVNR